MYIMDQFTCKYRGVLYPPPPTQTHTSNYPIYFNKANLERLYFVLQGILRFISYLGHTTYKAPFHQFWLEKKIIVL